MTAEPLPAASDDQRLLDLVTGALAAGRHADARRHAEQALARGLEHPLLLTLRAMAHEEAGRRDAALADLRRAHLLAPEDVAVLNALALCCTRADRLGEALACCDAAIAVRPDFAPSWFNRGWALDRQGDVGAAADSYGRAAELQPGYAEAWGNLAWLAARRGDAEATRKAAGHALALRPGFAQPILALAAVEAPASAELRLRELLDSPAIARVDRGLALGELGDALDALDRTAEAFEAYNQGNRALAELQAPGVAARGEETAENLIRMLLNWAETLDPTAWSRRTEAAKSSPAGEREHVFLIGFPRSGTTLVESVLDAHPDVVGLEERNTLEMAVRDFLSDPKGLEKLRTITSRQLQPYRDEYWRVVAHHGADPRGKVFLDKGPLKTLRLPLIWKLFPRAKVIFTVRDPRDVVFSCFRRRLAPNAWSYELLDLARAARFYAGVMRFAELLRPKQRLAEHRLVYERLVSDFDTEARELCRFLGLDWRDDLSGFADRARRGEVASASAAQISRGLFTEGVGQWRRYRAEMAPILAVLAPWVAHFGYSPG